MGKNYGAKKRGWEIGIIGEGSIYKNPSEQGEKPTETIIKQNSSQQEYDFKSGFITTSNGIRTGIIFHERHKEISIIPYTKRKNIQSLLFKKGGDRGIFSIREHNANHEKGICNNSSSSYFETLYTRTLWMTEQGTKELNSIKEVLELRQRDIEKYTGLEVNLQ